MYTTAPDKVGLPASRFHWIVALLAPILSQNSRQVHSCYFISVINMKAKTKEAKLRRQKRVCGSLSVINFAGGHEDNRVGGNREAKWRLLRLRGAGYQSICSCGQE